ncbi:hypothetical protein LCGC14_2627240, partial [marine sediment metagenome]
DEAGDTVLANHFDELLKKAKKKA